MGVIDHPDWAMCAQLELATGWRVQPCPRTSLSQVVCDCRIKFVVDVVQAHRLKPSAKGSSEAGRGHYVSRITRASTSHATQGEISTTIIHTGLIVAILGQYIRFCCQDTVKINRSWNVIGRIPQNSRVAPILSQSLKLVYIVFK